MVAEGQGIHEGGKDRRPREAPLARPLTSAGLEVCEPGSRTNFAARVEAKHASPVCCVAARQKTAKRRRLGRMQTCPLRHGFGGSAQLAPDAQKPARCSSVGHTPTRPVTV